MVPCCDSIIGLSVSDGEDCLQSDNEDSNDSWTNQDDIPAEVIIKLASK